MLNKKTFSAKRIANFYLSFRHEKSIADREGGHKKNSQLTSIDFPKTAKSFDENP